MDEHHRVAQLTQRTRETQRVVGMTAVPERHDEVRALDVRQHEAQRRELPSQRSEEHPVRLVVEVVDGREDHGVHALLKKGREVLRNQDGSAFERLAVARREPKLGLAFFRFHSKRAPLDTRYRCWLVAPLLSH